MIDSSMIANSLNIFTGSDLTETLAQIEDGVCGVTLDNCNAFLKRSDACHQSLSAAAELKRMAGQIDVTIHALGILLCLPHILERGEEVEYASLGAGNTGRKFDLETNLRVAEFKFIRWRGGSEAIRQNATFKDFFELAIYPTEKRRCLYLLGTEQALKFFNGRRALTSILSGNEKIRRRFFDRYQEQYREVGEYFAEHSNMVEIRDVRTWLPDLVRE